MKMPWQNLTGLAKLAAIFATILGIAVGLCGLNIVAVSLGRDYPGTLLTITAFFEMVAIVVSSLGLVVIGIIAIIRTFRNNPEDR
jgi:hypothetical protein